MTLPRRIRIGGGVWRLRVRRKPFADDAYGETDIAARAIALAPKLTPATRARTIIHEALHAMIDEAGLCADPAIAAREEKIVAALEAPLASFIADNPALMRRLAEDLKS